MLTNCYFTTEISNFIKNSYLFVKIPIVVIRVRSDFDGVHVQLAALYEIGENNE